MTQSEHGSMKALKRMPICLSDASDNATRLNNLITFFSEAILPDETILRLQVPNFRPEPQLRTPNLLKLAAFLKTIRTHLFHSFSFIELARSYPCQASVLQEEAYWEFEIIVPSPPNTEAVTVRINQLLDILAEILDCYAYEFGIVAWAEDLYGKDWFAKLLQAEQVTVRQVKASNQPA